MKRIEIPLSVLSLGINFLSFSILSIIFGTNIESISLISVLIICANLWAVAEYVKKNNNNNLNNNDV